MKFDMNMLNQIKPGMKVIYNYNGFSYFVLALLQKEIGREGYPAQAMTISFPILNEVRRKTNQENFCGLTENTIKEMLFLVNSARFHQYIVIENIEKFIGCPITWIYCRDLDPIVNAKFITPDGKYFYREMSFDFGTWLYHNGTKYKVVEISGNKEEAYLEIFKDE